ncbi:M30 family zinc metallopeptidase [Ralstonia pseudosolanacearum]|uniref:M30 family zinc metallopeptidase n=1 Tax=Ralstonia pseudosolanacearum TaxID=1310165 RepID=UPI002E206795
MFGSKKKTCVAQPQNVTGTRQTIWTATMMAVVAAAALTGCGGGGGGGSDTSSSASTTQATPASVAVAAACSGTHCGALGTTYAGSGVGIWQATNTGGTATSVPVSIAGLTGQNVTLIYTNQSAAAQPMPPVSLSTASLTGTGSTSVAKPQASTGTQGDANAAFDRTLSDFNAHALDGYASGPAPLKTQSAANVAVLRPQSVASVGTQRSWNHQQPDGAAVTVTSTLRQQATATDGRIVNLWVEDSEYGSSKISDSIINTLLTKFSSGSQSVYSLATSLAGQPWGAYSSSASLIDPNQALDIVVLNIEPDSQPYGSVGYFWARNNFTTSAQPLSNQSLSLYVDSETIYLGGTSGLSTVISTLGHEFTHMANFYQRGVLHGSSSMYGTWLEEMTAMTMEDALSSQIDASFNNVRDSRFPAWLQSAYDCSLTTFNASLSSTCPGYPISGSLGGFLLRQYGLSYYRNLLQNFSSTDSATLLNSAIQAGGGAGLGDAVARWGTAIALLPAASSPSGFAYPARTEGSFSIPAVNGPDYSGQRSLPSSVPATLQGYGHFPVTRGVKIGTYSETITVPAYSTVSIVVQ